MEEFETRRMEDKLAALSLRGFPHQAAIEVTKRCNAKCDYCYITQEPEMEMGTGQVKSIIDRFNDAGILSLIISGGEPFIRKDFLEILSYIIEKKFFLFSILSNGTLLNNEHISFLKSHSAYTGTIRFSFFSHIPEIHDKYIGVMGAFEKALLTASTLKASGIKIAIMINLMDFNIDNISTTIKFFESQGFTVNSATYKIFANDFIKENYKKVTSKEFYKKYFRSLEPVHFNALKKELLEELSSPLSDYLCGRRRVAISVNYRGELIPCLPFRDMPVANLLSDNRSLNEILSSSEIINTFSTLRRTHLEKCKNCRFINYCIICPGSSHVEFKSVSAVQDQSCNWVHALYETVMENESSGN
jgi:radical SAM protein with 4Fe4S-binding SPASM domain